VCGGGYVGWVVGVEMTYDDYDAIKAVHFSGLKNLSVSPLWYLHRMNNPGESKPAFALGSAAHCAILEPESFWERYAEYAPVRNGKEWDKWQEEHPGVQSLKPHEMEKALEVSKAVRKHRIAAALLRGGRAEEVVIWNDASTGLACKGRIDYLRPDFLIDLKTTRDPSPKKFTRAASDFGYLAQVAFYHDGAAASRLIDGKQRPYIIAIQNDAPYDVACFQLSQDALLYGREFYRSLMRRLLECTEANFWPGVAPDLQELGISAYAPEPYAASETGEDF
jgi:exodeoxyribonuclease VIII